MQQINVALGERSYAVCIQPGLLGQAGIHIAPSLTRPWVPIVTDRHVAANHLATLQAGLTAAGVTSDVLVLDPGEATKSWAGLARLTDWLVERGTQRGDHIIALGGGVIGDLVGFAASIVKRGCQFIQIPTSLLAQVDSSVGGKTAINIAAGKNLVGAFHQPASVFIDPDTLASLPRREMAAGYAEIVKYGLIDDFRFFDWCCANGTALLAGDRAAQTTAIAHSVAAKARIVAADERETRDIRALLNLGHTFGHALEAETGFGDALLHGEAVAAGTALAYAFSATCGLCSAADARRVRDHFAAVGLPHDLASAGIAADGGTLAAHMAHDKKARGGLVPLILTHGIGQAFVSTEFTLGQVATFLDQSRAAD